MGCSGFTEAEIAPMKTVHCDANPEPVRSRVGVRPAVLCCDVLCRAVPRRVVPHRAVLCRAVS